MFSCNQCDNVFPLKQTLVRHVKYKHGDNYFKCPNCIKMFTRKDVLHRHSKSCQNGNINYMDLITDPDSSLMKEKRINIGCHNVNSGTSNGSGENAQKRMQVAHDSNDNFSDYSSAGKYVNGPSKTVDDRDSVGNNSETSSVSEDGLSENGSKANLNSIDNPMKRVRLNSDNDIQNYEADDKSGSDKSENDSENEDVFSENNDNKSDSNTSENDSETGADTESECNTCKSESVRSNLTNGSGYDSGDDYNSGKDQSSSDMDVNESDVNECDCRECRRDMIKNINKRMPQNKLNDADSFASDLEDEFEHRSENNYESNSSNCPYRQYYTDQAKFGKCVATVPYNSGSSGSLLNGIMRTSVPLGVGNEK